MGAPRKFTPKQFQKAWDDYFQWSDQHPWYKNEMIKSGELAGEIVKIPTERPYSEMGFIAFCGLGENYLRQMKSSFESEDLKGDDLKLSLVLSRAIGKCRAQKFEGAAVGAFKENIIAREMGLWDRMKNDLSTGGKSLDEINVNINFPNEIE